MRIELHPSSDSLNSLMGIPQSLLLMLTFYFIVQNLQFSNLTSQIFELIRFLSFPFHNYVYHFSTCSSVRLIKMTVFFCKLFSRVSYHRFDFSVLHEYTDVVGSFCIRIRRCMLFTRIVGVSALFFYNTI